MIVLFSALMTLSGFFFYRLPLLQAASLDVRPAVLLECDGISIRSGDDDRLEGEGGKGIAADRDNTGTGFENVVLEVKDGAGNILFAYAQLLNVEATETGDFDIESFWGAAPLFNPVVARLYSLAGNGLNEQELLSTSINCPGLPLYVAPGAGAPGIPPGFVLRTIVCDVPVYNTPAGTGVEGANITSGQTWYVNPEVVSAGNGRSWTEIFTSGVINGFVPSVCVSE